MFLELRIVLVLAAFSDLKRTISPLCSGKNSQYFYREVREPIFALPGNSSGSPFSPVHTAKWVFPSLFHSDGNRSSLRLTNGYEFHPPWLPSTMNEKNKINKTMLLPLFYPYVFFFFFNFLSQFSSESRPPTFCRLIFPQLRINKQFQLRFSILDFFCAVYFLRLNLFDKRPSVAFFSYF